MDILIGTLMIDLSATGSDKGFTGLLGGGILKVAQPERAKFNIKMPTRVTICMICILL
jgi:hypothetical protein